LLISLSKTPALISIFDFSSGKGTVLGAFNRIV
jgi:hypothetical protein